MKKQSQTSSVSSGAVLSLGNPNRAVCWPTIGNLWEPFKMGELGIVRLANGREMVGAELALI